MLTIAAIVVIAVIVTLVTKAKRDESGWGLRKPLTEGVAMVLLPLIGGWLIGSTSIGMLINAAFLQWFGDYTLWIVAVPLATLLWARKESLDGTWTLGDGLMIIPAAVLGIALFHSTPGTELRTWMVEALKKSEEFRKEQTIAKEKAVKEAKKLTDNPPPPEKVSAEERKRVKWEVGSRTVRLPVRNDGQDWVVEGQIVMAGGAVGSHDVTIEGPEWVFRSAKQFPAGGPRICLKNPEGKFTEEFQPLP